jgi:glucose-1-phosphate cytidylyltransferase
MESRRKEDVVILCGGRGTRLQGSGESLPKPLVEIGSKPILWHVIQIYAAQGFRSFVLATGHRRELVESFAADEDWPEGVSVECVFTGEDTQTGGRVKHLHDRLAGRGTFCVTYADGVADINLAEELDFHKEHGGIATMAVVRPELQWGVAHLDGNGKIDGFTEKPRSEHWINGGFFCFEEEVFEYLSDSSVLEREPLEALASEGKLHGFRHTGFWECMDTYKDAVILNDLCRGGQPPWQLW